MIWSRGMWLYFSSSSLVPSLTSLTEDVYQGTDLSRVPTWKSSRPGVLLEDMLGSQFRSDMN